MALSEMKIEANGHLAYMTIDRKMFRTCEAKREDTEGIVEYARAVEGTKVGILFVEEATDKIKISFRSNGEVDVNKLAKQFNGGGHRQAAGARVNGSLRDTISWVIGVCTKVLRES